MRKKKFSFFQETMCDLTIPNYLYWPSSEQLSKAAAVWDLLIQGLANNKTHIILPLNDLDPVAISVLESQCAHETKCGFYIRIDEKNLICEPQPNDPSFVPKKRKRQALFLSSIPGCLYRLTEEDKKNVATIWSHVIDKIREATSFPINVKLNVIFQDNYNWNVRIYEYFKKQFRMNNECGYKFELIGDYEITVKTATK